MTEKNREIQLELLRSVLASAKGFAALQSALFTLQMKSTDPDTKEKLAGTSAVLSEVHNEVMACLERVLKAMEAESDKRL